MTEHRNDWGRIAVTAVISVPLSSFGWGALYVQRPTRAEVQEMMDHY